MLYLRESNTGDLALVLSWNSNATVQEGYFSLSKNPRPLTWEEHTEWWDSTTSHWKKFMVILVEDEIERPIGIVRISGLEDFSPQIWFTIGEVSLWGKGYGYKVGKLALDWLKKKGYNHTHISVLKSNKRALDLLSKLGYTEYGEAREGELWYQLKLATS